MTNRADHDIKTPEAAGTRIALWQRIVSHFERLIAEGDITPGSQLPPEPRLIEQFGVSRNTIRRAMAELEERGLIRIGQGQGTFVADRALLYRISSRTRFSQNLAAEGRAGNVEILAMQRRAAGEDGAFLGIASDAPVLTVRNRSWTEEMPLNLSNTVYPLERYPDLEEIRAQFDSQTKLLAHYGIADYVRLKTFFSARPPSEEEARLLQIPRSRWVMQTLKIDADVDGRPVALSRSCWSADRIEFVVEGQTEGQPVRPVS